MSEPAWTTVDIVAGLAGVWELVGRCVLAVGELVGIVDGAGMILADWIATSIWVFREQHPHATLAIQALVGLPLEVI